MKHPSPCCASTVVHPCLEIRALPKPAAQVLQMIKVCPFQTNAAAFAQMVELPLIFHDLSKLSRLSTGTIFSITHQVCSIFQLSIGLELFAFLSLSRESKVRSACVQSILHPAILTASFIDVSFLIEVCLRASLYSRCIARAVGHLIQSVYHLSASPAESFPVGQLGRI